MECGVFLIIPIMQHYFKGNQLDFDELKNKNVSLLYLDSQHYLWVGTYNMGVYRCHLERGTIDHFGIEQGLYTILSAVYSKIKKPEIFGYLL